jgi:hypothetical protein
VGPIIEFLSYRIDNLSGDAFIYKNGVVEVWTQEKTKVDYLWHRFEKVKIISKFSKDYGIYSFRHTAAIDLFYSFMKQGLTEHESILRFMPITGHATENGP